MRASDGDSYESCNGMEWKSALGFAPLNEEIE